MLAVETLLAAPAAVDDDVLDPRQRPRHPAPAPAGHPGSGALIGDPAAGAQGRFPCSLRGRWVDSWTEFFQENFHRSGAVRGAPAGAKTGHRRHRQFHWERPKAT